MNEKITKRSILFIIADVITLLIVLGIAYATFSYVKPGTKENRIVAGAITMSYTESSNKISIANAVPMSDASGEAMTGEGEYFDFTVSTNMTTAQPISYEVTAEKDNESTLADDEVRLYLEKYETSSTVASGETINYEEVFSPKAYTPIDSENATGEDDLGAKNYEMLLDTGEVTSSKYVYYRLRMWVAEDYTHTQNSNSFAATVNVYGKDVAVEGANGINLSKNTLTMQKGETKTITATITPVSAKNKNLIWESTNTQVAKVDSSGNITAIATGTTRIRVKTSDKSKTAECVVTVVDADATSVSLNTNSITLVKGNTNQLTATVLPTDASNKTVTWSSSSEGIATVSSSGLVTAVGVGEADIEVETVNGKTDTCHVTVTPVNVDTITISGANTVDVGRTTQLTTGTASDELNGSNILWSSSDTTKATVSSTGLVTGVGAGEVTITASVKEYPDTYATKVITVKQPNITSITMNSDITIDEGATAIFTIAYLPSNAGNIEDIEWISSNTSVAEVDCDGQTYCEIEGLAVGSTTITAQTTNSIKVSATLSVIGNTVYVLKTNYVNQVANYPRISNLVNVQNCSNCSSSTYIKQLGRVYGPFDLTKYNHLILSVTDSANGHNTAINISGVSTFDQDIYSYYLPGNVGDYDFDISSVIGLKYILIGFASFGNTADAPSSSRYVITYTDQYCYIDDTSYNGDTKLWNIRLTK